MRSAQNRSLAVATLLTIGGLPAVCGCLGVVATEVDPSEVVFISLDQQESLKPIPKDKNGKLVPAAIRDLEWSTSDPKVATVSASGMITSVGFGEAEVRVTAGGGQPGVVKVRVAKPAKVVVEPPEVELVGAGKTRQLEAKVFDEKGVPIPTRLITWSTKDKNVEVESGQVKSINVGPATVVARCGDATGEAKVLVKYPKVARLVVDPATLEMDAGTKMAIPIIGFGDDGKPLPLIKASFESTKPKIVRIDQDGILTAVKRGKAVVRAIADGHRAEAAVRVY